MKSANYSILSHIYYSIASDGNLRIPVDLVRHLRIERLLLGTGGLVFLALLPILSEEFEVDGLVGVRHEGLQL